MFCSILEFKVSTKTPYPPLSVAICCQMYSDSGEHYGIVWGCAEITQIFERDQLNLKACVPVINKVIIKVRDVSEQT